MAEEVPGPAASGSMEPAELRDAVDGLLKELDGRKRTEADLLEKVEYYRTLAEFATNWIFWRSPDGDMLYVSPSCERITGYPPSKFYESKDMFLSIVHPDDRDAWRKHSREAETKRLPGNLELRIIDKQGKTRWISHLCRPVFNETGRFLGIRGSNSDITERKQAEKALRLSEERLRDFFDNANEFAMSVAPDGRFLFVNRAWREALGYAAEDAETLDLLDVAAPDCVGRLEDLLKRTMSGENVGIIETVFLSKDGRRIVVEGTVNCRFEDGKPTAGRCIFRDITGKKQMEEELLKANMLESIGILAGGIAHDFNNILTAIMGNLSLAKLDVAPGDATWARLVEAEKAAIRAQSLTRQLLTFSKGGAPVRQASSIGQLIEESANFAIRGTTIKCQIAIAPDLHPVDIDPGQIGQVINNIVLNASQAMADGGIIYVDARNIVSEDVPERHLPPGDYVMVAIKDYGTGIPRENIPKIFNPFFTTKTKGTGLGLATAYSIVKRHDGAISVDSTLGRGTTVSIFLPGSRHLAPEIPAARPPQSEGKGRVLVMDDEEMVRDVAVSLLESMGYMGHAVKDGSEAIEAYIEAMKEGSPFDAVILDLTVPGAMGGKECVRRLLDIDASARVIVSSGYSQDPILSMYRDYGFSGVIAKPYQMGELGQAIQLVLPRPASRNN